MEFGVLERYALGHNDTLKKSLQCLCLADLRALCYHFKVKTKINATDADMAIYDDQLFDKMTENIIVYQDVLPNWFSRSNVCKILMDWETEMEDLALPDEYKELDRKTVSANILTRAIEKDSDIGKHDIECILNVKKGKGKGKGKDGKKGKGDDGKGKGKGDDGKGKGKGDDGKGKGKGKGKGDDGKEGKGEEEDGKGEEEDSCPFCLESLVADSSVITFGCGHSTCASCLSVYFNNLNKRLIENLSNRSPRCALCRGIITTVTSVCETTLNEFEKNYTTSCNYSEYSD